MYSSQDDDYPKKLNYGDLLAKFENNELIFGLLVKRIAVAPRAVRWAEGHTLTQVLLKAFYNESGMKLHTDYFKITPYV